MSNQIKIQRAVHNLTQADLANKLGVTRQTIIAIEAGRYSPSLNLAHKMAKLFKVSIEKLFF